MTAARGTVAGIVPGLALCLAIAAAAVALEHAERVLLGRAWLDSLVLAIVLGAIVATARDLPDAAATGVRFAAKPLLEVAIVLLGLTVDVPVLLRAGPTLAVAVIAAVAMALLGAYALGRVLGLRPTLAALVATGNAICGNTAIAAAAPVIGADAEDVAAAISFTAVLGLVIVLVLPALGAALALDDYQYGVVAGLTVYAVPQVLAATLPVSEVSGDVATAVKLMRVLLLGPVLIGLGIWARRSLHRSAAVHASRGALLPWFIAGFVVLAVVRASGVVPDALVGPVRDVSRVLTVVALAALGLGVDLRSVRRVGPRLALAAGGALVVLAAVAVALVKTVG